MPALTATPTPMVEQAAHAARLRDLRLTHLIDEAIARAEPRDAERYTNVPAHASMGDYLKYLDDEE